MPEVIRKPADKVRPYVSRNKIRRVMAKFPMYAEIMPPDSLLLGEKEEVSVYADFLNYLLDMVGNMAGFPPPGALELTMRSSAEVQDIAIELLEINSEEW